MTARQRMGRRFVTDPTLSTSASPSLIRSPRLRIAVWLLILILAVIRFFGPLHYDAHATIVTNIESVRVGYMLYKYGDWADPYAPVATGPTTHEPPLFPALIAGLYYLFGVGAKGVYSAQVLEAAVIVAEVMMIPLLAPAFGADLAVGFLAAMLAVLGLSRCYVFEHNYVGFLLVASAIVAARCLRRIDASGRAALTSALKPGALLSRPWFSTSPWPLTTSLGAMWGIILLMCPGAALVWMGWLLLGAWYSYRRRQGAWMAVAIVPVMMAAPWVWRNDRVFKSPVLLRGDLGLTLMTSNNPCAAFAYWKNQESGCYGLVHPNQSLAEAQKVRALGEVAYNRLKLKEAMDWISGNRRAFLRLTVQRLWYYWFPTPSANGFVGNWRQYLFIDILTLLSVPGVFIFLRVNKVGTVVLMSFLVLYPPVYYIAQFDRRYRFPILWVTCVLAAVTMWKIFLFAVDRRGRGKEAERG